MKREIFVISNDKIFFEKKNIFVPNNNLNTFFSILIKCFQNSFNSNQKLKKNSNLILKK